MKSKSDIKVNKIKELLMNLKAGDLHDKGIILMREGDILEFLSSLPVDLIENYIKGKFRAVPSITHADFRRWLVTRREALGLSQSELARRVDVRPEQINRYEKKRKPLNGDILEKIREVLSKDSGA